MSFRNIAMSMVTDLMCDLFLCGAATLICKKKKPHGEECSSYRENWKLSLFAVE